MTMGENWFCYCSVITITLIHFKSHFYCFPQYQPFSASITLQPVSQTFEARKPSVLTFSSLMFSCAPPVSRFSFSSLQRSLFHDHNLCGPYLSRSLIYFLFTLSSCPPFLCYGSVQKQTKIKKHCIIGLYLVHCKKKEQLNQIKSQNVKYTSPQQIEHLNDCNYNTSGKWIKGETREFWVDTQSAGKLSFKREAFPRHTFLMMKLVSLFSLQQ